MRRRVGQSISWLCVALMMLTSILAFPPTRAFADLRTITIGGGVSDWDGVATNLTDPLDVNGAQSEDLVKVWVASDANNLYVRWDAQLAGNVSQIASTLYGLAFSSSGTTTADAMAWVFFDSKSTMTVAVENKSGTKYTLSTAYAATANTGTKGAVASVEAMFPYTDITSVLPSFDKTAFNALWAETHASASMTSNIKDKVPEVGFMNYNPSTGGWYQVDPANTAPTITGPASATVTEDVAKVITLSATDAQQNSLTFTVSTQPTNGTLSAPTTATCTGTGPYTCTSTVTYTPAANYNGSDSFAFSVSDGSLTAGPANVSLTVSPVNDAPTLTVPGSQTVKQGQPLTFGVSATDPDPGDTLTYSVQSGPGSINSSGTYSWTPLATEALGSQTATIRVTDSGLLYDQKTVAITVTERDASLSLSTVTASPTSIRANGTDTSTITVQLKGADGGNLTQSHGTVTLFTDKGTITGTATYAGGGAYTGTLTAPLVAGTATITAKLDGQALTDTATVDFGANHAPDLTVPPMVQAKQDVAATFTAAATDPDGDEPITFQIVSGPGTLTGADYSWFPGSGTAPGTYDVVIRATDSLGAATEKIVSIAVAERYASLSLSTVTASPTSIRANGTDTSTITVQLKGDDGGNLTQSHGTVTLFTDKGTITGTATYAGGGAYTGTLTAPMAAGTATITAKLVGQALTDTASVTLVSNGAPDLTVPPTLTVKQDAAATFTATATDPEGDEPITLELVSGPGTLTGASYSWTPGSGTAPGTYNVVIRATDSLGATTEKTVSITVTERDASLSLSTVTASPTAVQANGTDTSTITVQLKGADGGNLTQSHGAVTLFTDSGTITGTATYAGSGAYTGTLTAPLVAGTATITAKLDGQALTDTATVDFGANHAPDLTVPPMVQAKQDVAATFTAAATDPDGDEPITFQIVSGPGTLTGADYSWFPGSGTAPGTYDVVIRATDSLGAATEKTVSIAVAERYASLSLSTVTASPTSIRANGTDTSTITVQLKGDDGGNLSQSHGTVTLFTDKGTITGTATYAGGGAYTGTLTAPLAAGTATITAKLVGQALTDTATVTFGSNLAPSLTVPTTVSVKQDAAATFTATATDPEGDEPITFQLVSGPGTLAGANYSWTPGSGTAPGTYEVVIRATDALGAATEKTVSIIVTERDASLSLSTVTASPTSIRANGTDTSTITVQLKGADGGNLTQSHGTVVLATTAGTLVGTVTDNGDGTYTGTLTAPLAVGTATITAKLNGQALTNTAAVTFTGAPPVAADLTPATNEDTAVSITLSATDADSANLTFTILSQPGHGSLGAPGTTACASGTCTTSVLYTPDANYHGTDSFTYQVSDGTYTDTATVSLTVNSVNDDPVLTLPAIASSRKQAQTLTFTATATDLDGDPLTFSLASPDYGATIDPVSGVFTWTPAATADLKAYTFTVQVTDGTATDSQSFTVTLTERDADLAKSAITASPTAIPADGTSTSTITVQLKGADGGNLTQSHGTVTLFTDNGTIIGMVTYAGGGAYTGTLRAPLTAGTAIITAKLDGQALTNTASVTFAAAPVAQNLTPAADEDTAATITLSATDADTAVLTFTIATQPSHGSVTAPGSLLCDGGTCTATVTYTPAADYHGTDSFTYQVSDGTYSDTATVTLTVNSVNDDPVLTLPAIASSLKQAATLTFTATATDADGDTLTFSLADPNFGATIDPASGVFTWTPAATAELKDYTFTVQVTDGTATDLQSFTITLTERDADLAKSTVSANPTEVLADGTSTSTITVQLKDSNGISLTQSHGTVTLFSDNGTIIGMVTYAGSGAYTGTLRAPLTAGTAIITAKLEGQALADTATVTFKGAPVAADLTPATNEDTAVSITLSATDADSANLTFTILSQPGHGSLGAPGTTACASGTCTTSVLYTPDANYHGTDSFTYQVSDGTYTDTATVSLTVNSVNDDPVLTLPAIASSRKQAQTLTFTATASDLDGDTLTFALADPNFGATIDPTSGVFTWTPAATADLKAYTFTVQVTDGAATDSQSFTVTLTERDADLAKSTVSANPTKILADGTSTSTITVQLKGADGGNLTLSHGTVTLFTDKGTITDTATYAGGGAYTGTLTAPLAAGTATITAKLDGQALTNTASVTFAAAPVAQNLTPAADEDTAATITLSATDADTAVLTFTIATQPTHGSVTAPGSLLCDGGTCTATVTYTPDANYHGTDSFTYQVSDGTYTDTATVTLTVNPVNDDPVLTLPSIASSRKQAQTLSFTATATDVDGDTLTFSLADPNFGATIDPASGVFTWTPAATAELKGYTFTVQVTDGTATDSQSFTVTLTERDADLAKSAITASPTAILADGTSTSTITVQLKDSNGISLTQSHGTVTLFTDKGTITGPVTYAGGGAYTGTLTAPTSIGTATVTAQLDSAALSAYVGVEFYHLGSLAGKVTTSSGRALDNATLKLETADGTPVTTTTTDGAGNYRFTDLASGSYRVTLPSSDPAKPSASGTADVVDNTESVLNLEVTSQATMAITANPEVIVGDGQATSDLRAVVKFTDGTAIPNVPVLFEAEAGAGTLSAATDTTDANGAASVTLTAPTINGTDNLVKKVKIFARDDARGIFNDTFLTITFQPAVLKGVVLDTGVTPPTPIAGATVTIDETFGNDDPSDDFHAEVKTDANGKYEIKVPKGNWTYKPVIKAQITVGGTKTEVTTTQPGQVGNAGQGQQYEAQKSIGGQVFLGTQESGGAPRVLQSSELQAEFVTGDTHGETVSIDPTTGGFTINNVTPDAEYKIRFRYVDPKTKEVLAGVTATIKASVTNGQVGLQAPLIDPFGIVRNTAGQPVKGAVVTLRWATSDPALGRVAGAEVSTLPLLAGFPPANNAVPQTTPASGEYAWMVFANASYYITVTHPEYLPWDSRTAGIPNKVVGDSNITNGVIYVGTDIVNLDITLQSPSALPSRPSAPISLTATPAPDHIALTWTPSPGASTYKLYRAESPNGPWVPVANGLTTTTYTDNSVTPGHTYYYYVTAQNPGGESDPSPKANATVPAAEHPPTLPPPPTAPAMPKDLKATPGDKGIDLTWTPSPGADCYTVYRSESPDGPFTSISACQTGTTFTDRDVTPGITYYYVVTAKGPGGVSDRSPVARAALPKISPADRNFGSHKRYIMGYPDGTFLPERSISRAEVATILARVLEADTLAAGAAKYPDVATTHWATGYIAAVGRLGLMLGDPNGNFRPEDPITRAEVATIAIRFKHLAPVDGIAFPDTEGHWAVGYIKAAFDAGLMQGYPGGWFSPQKPISRAEFVTVVNRLMGRGPLLDRPAALWPDVPTWHWAYGQVQEASVGHAFEKRTDVQGELWVEDK